MTESEEDGTSGTEQTGILYYEGKKIQEGRTMQQNKKGQQKGRNTITMEKQDQKGKMMNNKGRKKQGEMEQLAVQSEEK